MTFVKQNMNKWNSGVVPYIIYITITLTPYLHHNHSLPEQARIGCKSCHIIHINLLSILSYLSYPYLKHAASEWPVRYIWVGDGCRTIYSNGFIMKYALITGPKSKSKFRNEWLICSFLIHDDVIKWKHFPRYWPFVRGIHRSWWRGALVFSLMCARIKLELTIVRLVISDAIALIMTSS